MCSGWLAQETGIAGLSLFLSCHPGLLKAAAVLANEGQVWEFPEQGPSAALLLDVPHLAGLTLAWMLRGCMFFPRRG